MPRSSPGIDDYSRFCVSAKVVARATARAVCDALAERSSRASAKARDGVWRTIVVILAAAVPFSGFWAGRHLSEEERAATSA